MGAEGEEQWTGTHAGEFIRDAKTQNRLGAIHADHPEVGASEVLSREAEREASVGLEPEARPEGEGGRGEVGGGDALERFRERETLGKEREG